MEEKISISLKIKSGKGKEIILNEKEAMELYLKLRTLFSNISIVSIPSIWESGKFTIPDPTCCITTTNETKKWIDVNANSN